MSVRVLQAWPIYVNDDGVVSCDEPFSSDEPFSCNGQIIGELLDGRRHSLGEFVEAIRAHAKEVHGEVVY